MSVFSRSVLKRLAVVAGLLCLSVSGALARPLAASYAPVGAETSVPFGWVDFCQRYRNECQVGGEGPREIDLTDAARRRIEKINAWVNRNIDPVSDKEHWGTLDAWDYPTDGKGDCEDYALLKRRMLIEDGFPAEALLLTVVKDEHGDGHSILTVKTNRGEFVLDNLTGGVQPWTRAPYRFVKRQSQHNPNVWVAIGSPTSAPMYVSK